METPSLDTVTPPRRGRPTRARAEAIDRLIVETARTMFLDVGYGMVAMEAIAARTGVSKGTLYSRYSSKADLFAAVVEDRVRVWSARAADHDAELPQDLSGRLEHHVRIAIESMGDAEVAGFATMMLAARASFPELARIYFDRAVLHQVRLVAGEIAAADPECADPEAVAFALLEAALGWSSIRAMSDGDIQPGAVRNAASAIVRRTLRGFGMT
jgi:AcrR family transcriptional regulator